MSLVKKQLTLHFFCSFSSDSVLGNVFGSQNDAQGVSK